MATIVCQSLQQSSLESQVFEPRTTIRLKLSCSVDEKQRISFVDDGEKKRLSSSSSSSSSSSYSSHCWSFLQSVSKLETRSGYKETAATYVHPLDNRSKSAILSDRSLELCTENLGSETGTDDVILEDDISIVSPTRGHVQEKKCGVTKKVIPRNYPPPLTTIRGGGQARRLRPYREDGRLIIRATEDPPPRCPLFHAERSYGRLRLSLFKDYYVSEEDDAGSDVAVSCGDEEEQQEQEEEEEEGNNVKVHHHESGFDEEDEGVSGNVEDVGGEMGIKKFHRPGRCKEEEPEKKGLLNWEALWVVM